MSSKIVDRKEEGTHRAKLLCNFIKGLFGFLMYHLRTKNESHVSESVNNGLNWNLYRSNLPGIQQPA